MICFFKKRITDMNINLGCAVMLKSACTYENVLWCCNYNCID